MKFGIVGRTEDGLFRYQGWPTVCKDENGILYVGCSGHRLTHICPFGKNLMYVSCDEGKTWSAPMIINDTVLDDRDAGMLSLGKGKLLLSYFNHSWKFYNQESVQTRSKSEVSPMAWKIFCGMMNGYEYLPDGEDHAGSFVRLSKDCGKVWEAAVQVPVSAPHGPIKLSDGRLLYLGKTFRSLGGENLPICAYESCDDGKTWTYLADIQVPQGCQANYMYEPHAVELPDGKILGAIRVQSSKLEPDFTIYLCESTDGGKTWSVPRPTGICGSPPHLTVHSSGAVILSYGRRAKLFGQRARISYDGGATFGEEIVISEEAESDDLGYPSSVELSDGRLLTVYYQILPGDDFASILYTKWAIPER